LLEVTVREEVARAVRAASYRQPSFQSANDAALGTDVTADSQSTGWAPAELTGSSAARTIAPAHA
jgi:hypothetical protein